MSWHFMRQRPMVKNCLKVAGKPTTGMISDGKRPSYQTNDTLFQDLRTKRCRGRPLRNGGTINHAKTFQKERSPRWTSHYDSNRRELGSSTLPSSSPPLRKVQEATNELVLLMIAIVCRVLGLPD